MCPDRPAIYYLVSFSSLSFDFFTSSLNNNKYVILIYRRTIWVTNAAAVTLDDGYHRLCALHCDCRLKRLVLNTIIQTGNFGANFDRI